MLLVSYFTTKMLKFWIKKIFKTRQKVGNNVTLRNFFFVFHHITSYENYFLGCYTFCLVQNDEITVFFEIFTSK